ncbi:MAG: hypothetical protein OEL76_03505 [Siculibacillus sp.]|nr:hypothetical protein [Siculibacillus sp.]
MSWTEISRVLTELVGPDTRVAFDDDANPTELHFHRHDPLTADLVRDAVARAAALHPQEMSAITGVLVCFEDALGATRRRIAI